MEELKKLLGDEIYNKLVEKLGDNTVAMVPKGQKAFLHDEKDEPVISNNGEWIKKAKMDELIESKKALNDQVTQLSSQLETIKKANKDNESLTTEIDKLQNDIEKNKAERADLEKKYAFRDSLRDAGAKSAYIDLLEKAVPLDKIELDANGKVVNVDTLLNPLKDTYKESFGETKVEPAAPGKTGDGDGGKLPDGIYTKEEIKSMSQADVNTNLEAVNKSLEYHSTIN